MDLQESVSEKSFGEFRGDSEYQKIEREIRNKKQNKQQKVEKQVIKQGQIPQNQQLGEFLAQVQTVSNHNLQVATTYMMQLQQAESQLQKERELAYKALSEQEHLQRKYENDMEYNKNKIEHLTESNNNLVAQNIKYQGEAEIAIDAVQEKNEVIEEKIQLIQKLQNSYEMLQTEIQHLREVKKQDDQKIQYLINENKDIKIEEGAFKNLEDKVKMMEQNHEKETTELKRQAIQKEQQMIIEVRKREAVLKDQEPLRKEVQHLTDKYEEAYKNLQNTTIENRLLKEELQTLKDTFDEKLKREVYDTQVYNLGRVVDLEKHLQLANLKNEEFSIKNQQQALEIKQKEGEIEFYISEYKNFDMQMSKMKDERKIYLEEFNSLKKKYEKCIEDLQKQLKQNQFLLLQQQEETKNTKMQLDRYVQKLQDMVEMQNIIDVGNKYYQEKVKEKALDEHIKGLAAKDYEYKTKNISEEVDTYLNQDIQEKKQQLNDDEDEMDSQWNELYSNIKNVETKLNTNQEQLQSIINQNNMDDKFEY